LDITGWFQSIGYDSLAGILSFLLYKYLSFVSRQLIPRHSHSLNEGVSNDKAATNVIAPGLPPLFEAPSYESLPWRVSLYRLDALLSERSNDAAITASNAPTSNFNVGLEHNSKTNVMQTVMARNQSKFERLALSSRRTSLFLFIAYRWTGQLAHNCESVLYRMAGLGVPMTVAMHRSLVVLVSHLSWVLIGTMILSIDLYPEFFGRNILRNQWVKFLTQFNLKEASAGLQNCTVTTNSEWYTYEWNTSWVWWVVGGYLVSSWLFNVADMVNQILLPASVFRGASEGVVAQLISPENNDIWASIVGYVAPCLTAPIWEELLYRGFMLPTLCLFMPFWAAVVVSGLIFSAHHMSVTGFIPLMVLGMVWAILYAKCRNLMVTVLIHAMWNSRVFLGSWLGF
jgi:membrane protease YdiL (CAAX protease family)